MSDRDRTQDKDRQRRARNTRRLLWLLVVASVGTIAFYVAFFALGWFTARTNTWQLLVAAGATALALALIPVAFRLTQRDRLDAAGRLILLGITIVLVGSELILAGGTLYLAIGGTLILILAGYVALSRRVVAWLAAVVVFLLAVLLINLFEPLPRYPIGQSPATNIFVPAILLLIVAVVAWLAVRTFRIGTIRTRLLAAFVAIVLLLIVILSVGVAAGGFQGIRQQATNHLASVAILKEAEIDTWVEDLQFDLILALAGDEVSRRAIVLLEGPEDPSTEKLADSVIRTRFEQVMRETGRFQNLFLVDLDGKVILSSNPEEQGDSRGNQVYFREGQKGPYIQPPYYDITAMQTFVFASRPVQGSQGQVLGVLVGRASLAKLNEIMGERTGLGDTGETYLVASSTLLTPNRFGEQGFYSASPGIERAQAGQDGAGLYDNYRFVPVVGAYRWLPDLELALLAEQEQAETFRSIYGVLGIVGAVGLLGVFLAIGLSLLITRSIATPVAELADTASEIAAGDLTRLAKVEREDEIGTLAQAFNSMTAQLRDLIGSLEQRVAERTHELEQRSACLEAAATVGRAASSILETEDLIHQVVARIAELFGFYYVGLFLVDKTGEQAVLRAGAGNTDHPLPALGRQLAVGSSSMIGWSIANRQARVAQEASEDAVRLPAPELPDTRSEAALPLLSRGQVLGALTVQHTEPDAFDQDTVVVLQTMADQVAVALDNARLFAERQEALVAAQRAYGELSGEAWRKLLSARAELGYRSDASGVTDAGDVWRPEMEQALSEGRVVRGDGAGDDGRIPLAVPIRVRGEVVGVLDTYKPAEAGDWTQEELSLLQDVVGQLDVALESARLHQDAQRMAAREQTIRRITEQMRRRRDIEAILQSTLAELTKALGVPRAYVRLGTEAELSTVQGMSSSQARGQGGGSETEQIAPEKDNEAGRRTARGRP